MRIIRKSELKEGRWRNGMGVSWDIASDPPGTDDFGWRLAMAHIDADVPFSHYPSVDRVFTLIEGNGLDLEFESGRTLAVDRLFVPHPYPCDIPTYCRLRDGPCRALNLFTRRGLLTVGVDILSSNAKIEHPGPMLLVVLDGRAEIGGGSLECGDTVVMSDRVSAKVDGLLYAAKLTKG
ncbi:HutD family protein [Aestuariivirga sp.]|uniref:HutD/Ves family protein n=1 Tax=Aestuariivirga sp. TaxID=2650926 RepID=UPI0035933A49